MFAITCKYVNSRIKILILVLSWIQGHDESLCKITLKLANNFGDIMIYPFLKMAAIAILDIFPHLFTMHKAYLVVFINVKNLVGIDAVDSMM